MNRQREIWLAVCLMASCALYETLLFRLGYGGYFLHSLKEDGWIGFLIHSLGVIAIALLQVWFFYAALVSSWRWRVAYLTLFGIVLFFEYGNARALERFTNAHDLDVVLENRRYWRAMAGAFVDWRAFVPSAAFLTALFWGRPRPSRHLRPLVALLAVTFTVHSSYAARGFLMRQQDVGMSGGALVPTGAFQAFLRATTMFTWNHALAAMNYRLRDEVAYRSPSTPTQHVVLVIDESVSAGHLSIDGYPRPTTPWLEELARLGKLTNWGVAAAAANNTAGSTLCILTGVNRLPDFERRSVRQPTIFQYAKAMNYRTHLFDGQSAERRFGLSWDDLRLVDDYRAADRFGDDHDTDKRIGQVVAGLAQESNGQFIVVLKRGNHYSYEANYPKGLGLWHPSNDEDSRHADTMLSFPNNVRTADQRAALTNTYDNAIRYNIDGFFQALLGSNRSLPRTMLLYTSDHGEVLADEGTQALSRAVSWGMAAVPLLMVGDDRPAVDAEYRASHHNIFPTLLDLMGVPQSARRGTFGRSLLTARSSDRDPRLVLGSYLTDPGPLIDFDNLTRPSSLGSYGSTARDLPAAQMTAQQKTHQTPAADHRAPGRR